MTHSAPRAPWVLGVGVVEVVGGHSRQPELAGQLEQVRWVFLLDVQPWSISSQ
jgi:hypothetical protein